MRWGSLLLVAVVLVPILGSCNDDHSVSFTNDDDHATLARLTGLWEGGGYSLRICEDTSKSFCATDECNGKQCHDIKTGSTPQTFAYQTNDSGCDCYDCECFSVRAGFVMDAELTDPDGTTTPYTLKGNAGIEGSTSVLYLKIGGYEPTLTTGTPPSLLFTRLYDAERPDAAAGPIGALLGGALRRSRSGEVCAP